MLGLVDDSEKDIVLLVALSQLLVSTHPAGRRLDEELVEDLQIV
jgi:hypothetical protein